MPKLTASLVVYDGIKYIPHLFDSLREQTFKDWELLIIDNNSTDGTAEAIKKELFSFGTARFIKNETNVGFAKAHNMAYELSMSEYFIIFNQDLYLERDCFEKLTVFLDSNNGAGSAAPRLMAWNFEEKKFSNKVDSLGLKIFRNRRVVDMDQGLFYNGGERGPIEVFGVSGAIAIFRRSAINSLGYLFDESFGSYKEDVDLACRLRCAGWKSYVLPETAGYHDRSISGARGESNLAAIKNKSSQSETIRRNSYKNHLATLYKNEYWQNLILDFPWILWYELKKAAYFLLFDRQVLCGLLPLWKDRKKLKAKRPVKKLTWREFRKWYA